jgi:hypothetical protein
MEETNYPVIAINEPKQVGPRTQKLLSRKLEAPELALDAPNMATFLREMHKRVARAIVEPAISDVMEKKK